MCSNVSSVGTIAGCYVQDGKIVRSRRSGLVRERRRHPRGRACFPQALLRTTYARWLPATSCGIGTSTGFNDIHEGDIIEAYVMEQIKE